MHTSRYPGYHVNTSRDYITDGEESHRAPSDRTVSEYIVTNEHTTMVIHSVFVDSLFRAIRILDIAYYTLLFTGETNKEKSYG